MDGYHMTVRDIMTAHPVAVLPGDSIVTAARTMRDRGLTLLPVVESIDSMQLVGVISDYDIATRCTAAGHVDSCAVAEHMTTLPLHAVQSGDSVEMVIGKMAWAGIRRMPVVDAGRLVGIVSQADLRASAQRRDLELVESTLAAIIAKPRRRINHVAGIR
jgi:CBS domain-containing protein